MHNLTDKAFKPIAGVSVARADRIFVCAVFIEIIED